MDNYNQQATLCNLSIHGARIAADVVREMEIGAADSAAIVDLAMAAAVVAVVPAAMTVAACALGALSSAPVLLGAALLLPLALGLVGTGRRCYGVYTPII